MLEAREMPALRPVCAFTTCPRPTLSLDRWTAFWTASALPGLSATPDHIRISPQFTTCLIAPTQDHRLGRDAFAACSSPGGLFYDRTRSPPQDVSGTPAALLPRGEVQTSSAAAVRGPWWLGWGYKAPTRPAPCVTCHARIFQGSAIHRPM